MELKYQLDDDVQIARRPTGTCGLNDDLTGTEGVGSGALPLFYTRAARMRSTYK
jgi:hypothetical protein